MLWLLYRSFSFMKKILPIFFGGYKKMDEGRGNIIREVMKMCKRLSGKRKGERRQSERRQRYSKVERERETVGQRGGWRGQKGCSLPLLSPAFQIPRTSVQNSFLLEFHLPLVHKNHICCSSNRGRTVWAEGNVLRVAVTLELPPSQKWCVRDYFLLVGVLGLLTSVTRRQTSTVSL